MVWKLIKRIDQLKGKQQDDMRRKINLLTSRLGETACTSLQLKKRVND